MNGVKCVLVMLIVIPVILWLGSSDAMAQVQQTFPGARTMAMGGSFVGLADDATCMWYNPAGLAFVKEREAMIEAGVNAADEYDLNFFTGEFVEAEEEFDLRFLSVVGNARERAWNWGISYYRPWFAAKGISGLLVGPAGQISEEQEFYRASLALGRGFSPFETPGGETSYRVSLGASLDLNYSTLEGESNVPGFDPEDDLDAFEEGYSLGVLLHLIETANFGLKVGAVYHSDEELDFDLKDHEAFRRALFWGVPEQFSVGPSLRMSPYVTVSLTYEQIRWSDAQPVAWYDDEERYAVGTEVLVPIAENFTLPLRAGYTRSENDGNAASGVVGGVRLGADYSSFDYTSQVFSVGTGFVIADRHFLDFAYGYLMLDRFGEEDDISVFSVSYAITF